MKKEIDPQESYSLLLRNNYLTPCFFKNSIKMALSGENFFDFDYIEKITEYSFFKDLLTLCDLSNAGINLNKEMYLHYLNCYDLLSMSTNLRINYGWGIPTNSSISKISDFMNKSNIDGILEVGAGSGLWSGILSKRTNKNVIACDIYCRNDTPKSIYYPVIEKSAEEILKKIKNHAILLVWADTNDVSFNIAKKLKDENYIILVGPQHVTGTNQFYNYLKDNFTVDEVFFSSSFSGTKDPVFILKKTKNIHKELKIEKKIIPKFQILKKN